MGCKFSGFFLTNGMLEEVCIAVPLSPVAGPVQLRIFCDSSLRETVVPVSLGQPLPPFG